MRRIMVNAWSTWCRRKWRGEKPAAACRTVPRGDIAAEKSSCAWRCAIARNADRAPAGSARAAGLRRPDRGTDGRRCSDCAVGTVKSTMSQALAKLRADRRLAELPERKIQ